MTINDTYHRGENQLRSFPTCPPAVPVRHWVLSLPRWARWLLARGPSMVTRTLEVALRPIFANLRRQARRAGVHGSRAGALTFVQRFGGSLN
jgi:hypothetical protein